MPSSHRVDHHAVLKPILKKSALFAEVPEEQLESIMALCREVACKAGQEIFDEDSEGTELYIMPQGRVSVEIRLGGEEAHTERIYQVKDNEIFGELALLDGHRRSAKTRAMEDLRLLVIRRSDLFALMEQNSRLGYIIMRNLSKVLARKLRDSNMALRNALMEQKHILNLLHS